MKNFEYKLKKIMKKQTGGQAEQGKMPKYSVKRAILIGDTLHFDIINEHNCTETLSPADIKVNFNTLKFKQDILNLNMYFETSPSLRGVRPADNEAISDAEAGEALPLISAADVNDNLQKEQFAFHKSEYYPVRDFARGEFYARNIKNYEIYGFTAENIKLDNSPMRYVPAGQHVEISI